MQAAKNGDLDIEERTPPKTRNEPGSGDPAAAKRGKAAEQGKQAASGGEGLSE